MTTKKRAIIHFGTLAVLYALGALWKEHAQHKQMMQGLRDSLQYCRVKRTLPYYKVLD